jgi:hypothetical protein
MVGVIMRWRELIVFVLLLAIIHSSRVLAVNLNYGSPKFTIEDALLGLSSSVHVENKTYVFAIKTYENRVLNPILYVSVFNENETNVITQKLPLASVGINYPEYLYTYLYNGNIYVIVENDDSRVFVFRYDPASYSITKEFDFLVGNLTPFSAFDGKFYFPYGVVFDASNMSAVKFKSYASFITTPFDNGYIFLSIVNDVEVDGNTLPKYIIIHAGKDRLKNAIILPFSFEASFTIPDVRSVNLVNLFAGTRQYSSCYNYVYPIKPVVGNILADDDSILFVVNAGSDGVNNLGLLLMTFNKSTGDLEAIRLLRINGKILNATNNVYNVYKIESDGENYILYVKIYAFDGVGDNFIPTSVRSGILLIFINKDNFEIDRSRQPVLVYDYLNKYSLVSDVKFYNDRAVITVFEKNPSAPYKFIIDNSTPGRVILRRTSSWYYGGGVFYVPVAEDGYYTYKLVSTTRHATVEEYINYYRTGYSWRRITLHTYTIYNGVSNTFVNDPRFSPYISDDYYTYYSLRVVDVPVTKAGVFGISISKLGDDTRFRISISRIFVSQ